MTFECAGRRLPGAGEVDLHDDQRPAGFDVQRPHLSDFRPSRYGSGNGHNQRRSNMG